jgi:hypothetical protein
MPTDHLRYDLLAQEALRGVVQRVLTDAAKNGLPGDHHFYISFDTRMPGVRISPRLREKYPEEMTIVLQHQFWDLIVAEQGFEVGLSFNGVPERLVVPFEAIKGFFDPSVQFGLQFEVVKKEGAEGATEPTTATPLPPAAQPSPATRRGVRTKPAKAPAAKSPSPSSGSPSSPPPAVPAPSDTVEKPGDNDGGPDRPAGAEVVRLDRFRKK